MIKFPLNRGELLVVLLLAVATININAQQNPRGVGPGTSKVDSLLEILPDLTSSKEKADLNVQIARLLVRYDSLRTSKHIEEAIEAAQKAGYEQGMADALYVRGQLLAMSGAFGDSKKTFEESISYADLINYYEGRAVAYNGISITYLMRGGYDSALHYSLKSIENREKMAEPMGLAKSYGTIGNIYYKKGLYTPAIEYYVKSLGEFESEGDDINAAVGYNNVGVLYEELDENDRALEYYNKSLEIMQAAGDWEGMAMNYTNIGSVMQRRAQYETALEYFQMALEATLSASNRARMGGRYHALGNAYLKLKEYQKANEFLTKALEEASKNEQQEIIAKSKIDLGILYQETTKRNLSLTALQEALTLSKSIGNMALAADASIALSNVHSEMGNHREAYDLYIEYNALTDSIANVDNAKRITRIQTEYEYNQKEEQLKAEQEIKEASLRQENQRNLIIAGSGGSITIVIALFIYFQYRQRNRYAKVVEEKNEQLSETMASKEKLFSIIAHDLKSPLSAFSSISATLADNIDSFEKEQIATFLKKFEKSSHNLSGLLNNLLQWSLSQTGSLKVQPENLNIKESMESAVRPLTDLAESKGVKLTIDVEAQTVSADARMLETIIRNLVSNALKFTHEGGSVTLSTRIDRDHLLINVQDSGIGMEEEEAAKLFDVKYDPSKIGEHEEKGTGLGLILSKELVEKNNGTIGVKTEKHKGSVFYFTIPLAA